ncbi:MAG: hypothetical protein ACRD2T_16040, partial [Thermoanaerobaculia bacterium]
VQVPAALRLSRSASSLVEGSVGPGETRRFVLEPFAWGTVRVTLVWDDPAGDPALPRSLVNDLDLRILEELDGGGAITHAPWTLDPEAPDQPARRGVDRINNLEQVEIDFPPTGRLAVLVTGADVPRGPQRFWVAACAGCALTSESVARVRRGDGNADGEVDIADPIALFAYLFIGGPILCRDGADANDDGRLDIADGIRLLNYLFLGAIPRGAPPLDGRCAIDRTFDRLDCAAGSLCP